MVRSGSRSARASRRLHLTGGASHSAWPPHRCPATPCACTVETTMLLSFVLPRGSEIVLLGRDGAPSPSDLCGPPLSETAPVNPVLLSKNSFRFYSWLFVRFVVQKNKKLELAEWYGFPVYQLSVLTLLRMFLKNQTKAKHLSVTENPKLRSCCQPKPVRMSGCSA